MLKLMNFKYPKISRNVLESAFVSLIFRASVYFC